jgi:transcriptional regulator with XRE-family HTH domain
MEDFHFGKNLKRIREEKDKAKQDVMATELNMAQSTLSKIEQESYVPHDDFVTAAANYLKVDRRELLPPRWFVETVKRRVWVLNVTGRYTYIFFIGMFAFQFINDVSDWQQRSVLEKILLVAAFVLAGFLLYRFTVRKIEITEY